MSPTTPPFDPNSPWFVPLFVLLWFLVTGLLAVVSGWTGLAKRWRTQNTPEGERFRMASAAIGARFLPVSYSNCLTVVVSDKGLAISILFPFRFLSPPLFIPWSQVSHVSEGRFLFFRHVIVEPLNHWSRIKLYGKVGSKVVAASAGRIRGAA